ncbi:rhomboid family intramembrane serine protease [Bacillus sp. FJAT-27225]|uniref:rhomboid family intramembrane serine protease n=1 Tax=Bacillus sp. FJAT-27225 TaxID=1743144 RepID=UPI00080C2DC0|nr:rhomboid family intramembrane serine protease [Bacillus sp. FJAT-27225]OCA89347.1 rhomboid family intramembrane serine protease [Bacillus sp. FJAT-27225]
MFTRTESLGQFIRFYPIVSAIIAVNIVIYLSTELPFLPNYWIMERLTGVNLYIAEGEWWRLVTPIFMHGGFSHLLFNCFSLVLFGPGLERMLGRGKFVFVYLLSGIAANVATFILEPLSFSHVGSSGAIFGLFGYYVAIVLYKKNRMSQSDSQIILTIAAISVVMTFFQPNINITAHVFGILAGFLIGASSKR